MSAIEALRQEQKQLIDRLARPETLAGDEFARFSSRVNDLTEMIDLAERLVILRSTIAQRDTERTALDPELRSLADEELERLRQEERDLTLAVERRLTREDPFSGNDAVLEIRAGTGGEEASLFAAELFSMYTKYAAKQGWTVSLVSANRSDLGGYKEVITEIRGTNAYGILRFESGVHRVQRIPETEKAGRVHTSTATVAVLPVAAPTDVEIGPNDLKIDTFRASGHGGQHVQKTESAVRVTHLPTGTTVSCQDERSQHANKERALAVLRSRLLAVKLEQQRQQQRAARRAQIGTGDRSEKIRTYNIPQDRVTDHRIQRTWHGIDRILGGELGPLLDALQNEARTPFA